MAREINLNFTQAQWKRISAFTKAEEYGVDASPERTAPFRFALRKNGTVEIMIDEVRIGWVSDRLSIVTIREGFPEKYDIYLKRALNQLNDINSEVTRYERNLKRQQTEEIEQNGYLFLMPKRERDAEENFKEMNLSENFVKKGIGGLAQLNDIDIFDSRNFRVKLNFNDKKNNNVYVEFAFKDNILYDVVVHDSAYRVSDNLIEVLKTGYDTWHNHLDMETLLSDVQSLGKLPKIDQASLNEVMIEKHKKLEGEFTKGSIKVVIKPQSAETITVYHNALPIAVYHNMNHCKIPVPISDETLSLSGHDMETISNYVGHCVLQTLGINPEQILLLNEDLLSKKFDGIDFGYYA